MSGSEEETPTTDDSGDGSQSATEDPTAADGGTDTPADGGTSEEPSAEAAPTQEEFDQAFAAVTPEIDDSEVATIEAPSGEEEIAGETADMVNAGVQLIKLVANSSSVTLVKDGYANALPAGVKAEDLSGWQPNKRTISLGSGTSPWWQIWNVDWNAKILVTFMYGGNAAGSGAYVDQAHVALTDVVLPPDFSFEVEAAFPSAGLRMTPATVGAIQLTVTWRLKGFLGQLLSSEKSMVMLLVGTGEVQDV